MINGFLRIASCSPSVKVADVDHNVNSIIEMASRLDALGVEVAVFPEMCVTGYTCADLFHNVTLLEAAREGLDRIAKVTEGLNVHIIVGLPVAEDGAVYNCAALLRQGRVDIVRKTFLPAYNEFYESRWFAAAPEPSQNVFESHGAVIGIEICEDLWVATPASTSLAMKGAQVVFNLSASDDVVGKYDYLRSMILTQSTRITCAYAYASCGFGESTTDLVFLPKTIIAERGLMLAENNREDFLDHPFVIADVDIMAINRDRMHTTTWADAVRRSGLQPVNVPMDYNYQPSVMPQYRFVDPHPFVPSNQDAVHDRCREIVTIQECGLARRLKAIGSNRIVVGISGGLDSTLALLVAVETIKKLGGDVKDVVGVTMPGFGTTDRTYDNALALMRQLGITIREIPIGPAVTLHFTDIGHDPSVHDVTYENSQARERTQILMDIANQVGGIVLGTGDLSELALGWATYNGDQMSMYGINASVPKTLVQHLVRWFAHTSVDAALTATLLDIVDTPISPELTPADEQGNIKQKTEDLVGPYELHDFFLYYMLRFGFSPRRVFLLAQVAFKDTYPTPIIYKWMRTFYWRFFSQQFKRSCMPDGPKVGSVCLSPRGDWRMPSDASSALWMAELDSIAATIGA